MFFVLNTRKENTKQEPIKAGTTTFNSHKNVVAATIDTSLTPFADNIALALTYNNKATEALTPNSLNTHVGIRLVKKKYTQVIITKGSIGIDTSKQQNAKNICTTKTIYLPKEKSKMFNNSIEV